LPFLLYLLFRWAVAAFIMVPGPLWGVFLWLHLYNSTSSGTMTCIAIFYAVFFVGGTALLEYFQRQVARLHRAQEQVAYLREQVADLEGQVADLIKEEPPVDAAGPRAR
jgi:hypothetical protein